MAKLTKEDKMAALKEALAITKAAARGGHSDLYLVLANVYQQLLRIRQDIIDTESDKERS